MDDADRTIRLGLLGWPLQYSLSPVIHQEFFRSTGLCGEYIAYPVLPERFSETVLKLLGSGVTGLNVTYPHKCAAAGMCDELENCALDLQVINTIKTVNGRITGYNTDVHGFKRYIEECCLPEPFFIVGSGSVALAADYVLHERNMQYKMYCRNPRSWSGLKPAVLVEGLSDVLLTADRGTVVNATTLGWEDDDIFPLEKSLLRNMVFADLNYNSSWRWRNDLLRRGVSTYTGATMLVHQAARSFEIWTGIYPGTISALEIVREKLRGNEEGL